MVWRLIELLNELHQENQNIKIVLNEYQEKFRELELKTYEDMEYMIMQDERYIVEEYDDNTIIIDDFESDDYWHLGMDRRDVHNICKRLNQYEKEKQELKEHIRQNYKHIKRLETEMIK